MPRPPVPTSDAAADLPEDDHDAPQIARAEAEAVTDATRSWLEKAVIGLNLCPFAKAVHRRKQIRFVVTAADHRDALAADLKRELALLQESDPDAIDTTLIIHPLVLTDFHDYNAFLPVADRIVKRMGLVGEVQIASFHPDYVFGDNEPNAIENCTNRSPYPMLHLLRESSIARAVASFPQAEKIYLKNIDTMQALGQSGWDALGIPAPIRFPAAR